WPRNLEATKLMQQTKKQKWATGSPTRKRQKTTAGNGISVQISHVGRTPRSSEFSDSIMLCMLSFRIGSSFRSMASTHSQASQLRIPGRSIRPHKHFSRFRLADNLFLAGLPDDLASD